MLHRELWLTKATDIMRARWAPLGIAVPADVKMTCGFPGGGSPRRRIGECWPRARSAAGVNEVMISPVLEDRSTCSTCSATNCCTPSMTARAATARRSRKNSKPSATAAASTARSPAPKPAALAQEMLAKLGAYPHGKVELTAKKRNASHGLHKLECGCGNVSYMTAKKIEELRLPGLRRLRATRCCRSEREKKKVVETI